MIQKNALETVDRCMRDFKKKNRLFGEITKY